MLRLQCDLQYYRAQIHKLEQERQSPRTSNPSNSDETFLPNNDGQPGRLKYFCDIFVSWASRPKTGLKHGENQRIVIVAKSSPMQVAVILLMVDTILKLLFLFFLLGNWNVVNGALTVPDNFTVSMTVEKSNFW